MLLHLHRNQPSLSRRPDGEPLTGLVRTHWMLAVCVVCVHGEVLEATPRARRRSRTTEVGATTPADRKERRTDRG